MILKELSPGVIKLAPDGSVLAKVLQGVTARTNAGRMSASVVISTEDEDRSGDIVVVRGIDLRDHQRNPVALLNHDKDAPIGRFADPLGSYTVKTRGDRELVGEIYFNQSSQFAHDVFRAVEEKVFSGVSIGFIPVKVEKRHTRGHVYHEGRMVEGSILTIGDNPNAIVEAVHKGFSGKALCPELLDILRPLCPERTATVAGGWETKAMPANPRDTMQGGQQPDPMAPDAPVEGVDPNAQDPGDQGGPQAGAPDHASTVNDAVGNIMASWYQELCDGRIDAAKFKKMTAHLADTRDIHAAAAMDDLDDEDLEDDDYGDDGDADADADLEDDEDEREKAEKMCQLVWVKAYQPAMVGVHGFLSKLATADPFRLDVRKIQGRAAHHVGRMEQVPAVEKAIREGLMVRKAVGDAAGGDADADLDPAVLAELGRELAGMRTALRENITG